MKKTIARVFLPFFLFFAIVAPARAFVPIALAGYSLATGAAGGALTLSTLDAVGLAVIGAGLGYLAIDYTANGTPEQVRIPLSTNPARVVPAPVAPVTATPVSTPASFSVSSNYFTGNGDSVQSLCQSAWDATRIAGGQATSIQQFSNVGGQCTLTLYGSTFGAIITTVPAGSTCPSGYALNSGSCNLTNARTAAPDNKCDYSVSGSALAQLSDPDCTRTAAANPAKIQPDGSIVGAGTSNGSPQAFKIVPLVTGGSHVELATQKQQGTSSVVETIVFDVSPTGEVVSSSAGTNLGSISLAGDVPIVTSGTAVAPSAAPTAFPSDYARAGEAQAAAAPIVQGLTVTPSATIPDTEDADIAQLVTPPNFGNYDADQIRGTIPLPFSTDDCVPMSMTFLDRPMTMDLCTYHAAWHPFVNYGTAFMGALMTLRVLFGRKESEV